MNINLSEIVVDFILQLVNDFSRFIKENLHFEIFIPRTNVTTEIYSATFCFPFL